MSFPLAFILLLFVGLIAFVFLTAAIGRAYSNYKLKIKQKLRKGYSKEEFIKHFTDLNFNEQTINNLYNKIKSSLPSSFIPHPNDNLSDDYQLHKDYLSYVALDLFRKTQGQSPNIEQEKYLSKKKSVDTFVKILNFAEKKI